MENNSNREAPTAAPRRRFLKQAALAGMGLGLHGLPAAAAAHRRSVDNPADVLAGHPAAPILQRLFPAVGPRKAVNLEPARRTKADYLPLITGNVSFFQKHQNESGAIIDPFEKKERQYSTPAFACAAALAVTEAGRADLLPAATRAFTFALEALANKTTADGHADFYIPMLVHAHRRLKSRVAPDVAARWRTLFGQLDPVKTYRDTGGRGNWNLVNVAGEFLRRKDGLVVPALADSQMAYLERSLSRQEASGAYTAFGLYKDAPVAPMAYDAFPRLWLEDVIADNAYNGPHAASIRDFLTRGGLSTLLLLSPSGEWANGGRSASHQWNEAQIAVICETNANRWKAWGRPDIAGAFKRAAHLAVGSMARWQRPSGEMWIVKNRAEPARRHGYEGYSFFSQYNLLAVAMLAIAYEHADDTIAESLTPSEVGGYVFDIREPFHKICAAAGGTYALIDTGADSHYDATGLLRVHRAGVSLSPYSSNAASHRWFGPGNDPVKVGLTPGIAWKEAADAPWRSLANFDITLSGKDAKGNPVPGASIVASTDLNIVLERPHRVAFTVRSVLQGKGARTIEDTYTVSASGVDVRTVLGGSAAPAAARIVFPVLVSDGATDSRVAIQRDRAAVQAAGATLTWELVSPPAASGLTLDGPRIPIHDGYQQALVADLPPGTREVRWRVRLQPETKADAA